jgi:MoaA/NifB/PqqE/SkfB family radical SAM enzyme
MLAEIYRVPAEQVVAVTWKGDSNLYDYELSKLGNHHSRFCVVNAEFANTNITELITDIPYTGRCVVWYKDSTWAVKLFNQGWQREFGYTNLEFKIPRLDVVFISYNEPNAEKNWQRVLEKAPYAKRVNGVKGIFEAHQAAARLARSDMFYVVDGDAYLENSWTFDFQPTLYDRDCAYIWNSRNPINNLVYGYGGVKLFPRKQILAITEWQTLDFATTAVNKLKVMNVVSNITAFNTDEFSTWRSAFRETVKLYNNIKLNPNDQESKDRLHAWETIGNNMFGKYSIDGAKAAKEFADSNNDQTKINDRDFLKSIFDKPSANRYRYIKLEHARPENKDWFVVNWCLGNTCNFKCSYCPADLHNATNPWPDLDVIKNFITQVKSSHPDKKIYFEFTGGEVTLYKHFIDVCKFCTEQGIRVGFISNGSRTLRWWEENMRYFDHVCLSFHPEFADEKHFISVVKLLHNDIRTHVNVMMSPERFDFCYAVANKIKNIENISMALQPLIHDFGEVLYDYTDSQKKVFEKQHELIVRHIKHTKEFDIYRGAMRAVAPNGASKVAGAHRFISENLNNWSGWKCYAGVEQLIVDMDGTIRRGWCKVGDTIGNISDTVLTLPTDPIVCTKTMCHCNFDIMSTKEL